MHGIAVFHHRVLSNVCMGVCIGMHMYIYIYIYNSLIRACTYSRVQFRSLCLHFAHYFRPCATIMSFTITPIMETIRVNFVFFPRSAVSLRALSLSLSAYLCYVWESISFPILELISNHILPSQCWMITLCPLPLNMLCMICFRTRGFETINTDALHIISPALSLHFEFINNSTEYNLHAAVAGKCVHSSDRHMSGSNTMTVVG